MPGADACSVTVRRADRLMTLAGSTGLPSGLDLALVRELLGAPAWTRPRRGARSTPQTWRPRPAGPRAREYALATGVRCVLALPLAVEGETGAALNLYGLGADSLAQARGGGPRLRGAGRGRGERGPCASSGSGPRRPMCAPPCSPAAS